MREQPWPSGNAPDSDQRGPGFEAHRRPLVTSGRASGLNSIQFNFMCILSFSKLQYTCLTMKHYDKVCNRTLQKIIYQ